MKEQREENKATKCHRTNATPPGKSVAMFQMSEARLRPSAISREMLSSSNEVSDLEINKPDLTEIQGSQL